MALDFTVVINVRHRFGDKKSDDVGLETGTPFAGLKKDFDFKCLNVDSTQFAILLFQSQGVNITQGLEINGHKIYGGIPSSVDYDTITDPITVPDSIPTYRTFMWAQWKGNVMLVHPGVLKESNVLRIQTSKLESGQYDDFIIDNVVVVFKTDFANPAWPTLLI